MKELPLDFTGVGVAKSGTTWIHTALSDHPKICCPVRKELNYFIDKNPLQEMDDNGSWSFASHRGLGSEWLNAMFEHAKEGQIKGDITPAYFGDEQSPHYLFENNPDMKLFISYRNPVDALFSAYTMFNECLCFTGSFEDAFDENPEFIDYFRIHKHTAKYLEVFPRDQFHFLLLEDIKDQPSQTYKDLCRFLEVDELELPEANKTAVNARKRIRSRRMRDFLWNTHSFFNYHPAGSAFKKVLKAMRVNEISPVLHRINMETVKKPEPMQPKVRAKLADIYRDEIASLAELIGRDLSHWNT